MTVMLRMVLGLILGCIAVLSPLHAQSARDLVLQLPTTFFGSPRMADNPSTPDRVLYHKAAETGYRVIGIRISDQSRVLGPGELKFATEDAKYAGDLLAGQGAAQLSKSGFTSKKFPKAQGYFIEHFNPQTKEWVQFWGLETGKIKYIVSVTVSLSSERKAAKKAVTDYFFPKAKFAGSLSGLK